jgi:hypothetical protein
MLRKNVIISAVVLSFAGVSILGASHVAAQNTTHPESPLIQKIAEKFNLKNDEVQKVFDEHHTDMKRQMEVRFEDKLNKLVTDGKLTESQKQLLSVKLKELREKKISQFKEMKDMTPEERKAVMQKEKDELDAWAKEQGIDLKTIFEGNVFMFHRVHGGMGERMFIEKFPSPTQ